MDVGIDPADMGERLEALSAAAGGGIPPYLYLSLGAWPSAALLADPDATAAALEAGIGAWSPAALGECGLDYRRMEAPPEAQLALFRRCAALARDRGLPLIVHSREADDDTLRVIRETGIGPRTLMHCFSYGPASAAAYVDMGASISFAGNLGYKGSEGMRDAARLVPLESLLVETDAPYMTPGAERGKRPATPLDADLTLGLLAELREEDPAVLAQAVEANARALFG
jgi:TatD DNase family protein